MVDIEGLIRPHLVNVQTYGSMDPPEVLAQRAGIPADRIVKLNGNENPYGPSPKAIEAVARVPLHVYPDPLQRSIRDSLSEYTGLGPEYLIAGAGADEVMDMVFRLFVSPGDRIVDCDPTFAMYAFLARVADAGINMVPRDELFDVDVGAVKDAIDDRTRIIFITSPNNPTGNVTGTRAVLELLETGRIVVVDEAYFEFWGATVAGLVPDHDNLIVLRTLSKWAGLAGLRFGYGIMSPEVVGRLMDIKSPYNINVAAEAAAKASLDDAPALLANVEKIVAERERLFVALDAMPGLTPSPSFGNYILCRVAPGTAGEVYEGLANQGIFVRRFQSPRLADYFRVAVGSPSESDAFLEVLGGLV